GLSRRSAYTLACGRATDWRLVVLFFFLVFRRPPSSTLFPYTTLFRSLLDAALGTLRDSPYARNGKLREAVDHPILFVIDYEQDRSEEHTSELQSLAYLVCRLLLEKKKKKKHTTSHLSQTTTHYQLTIL